MRFSLRRSLILTELLARAERHLPSELETRHRSLGETFVTRGLELGTHYNLSLYICVTGDENLQFRELFQISNINVNCVLFFLEFSLSHEDK